MQPRSLPCSIAAGFGLGAASSLPLRYRRWSRPLHCRCSSPSLSGCADVNDLHTKACFFTKSIVHGSTPHVPEKKRNERLRDPSIRGQETSSTFGIRIAITTVGPSLLDSWDTVAARHPRGAEMGMAYHKKPKLELYDVKRVPTRKPVSQGGRTSIQEGTS